MVLEFIILVFHYYFITYRRLRTTNICKAGCFEECLSNSFESFSWCFKWILSLQAFPNLWKSWSGSSFPPLHRSAAKITRIVSFREGSEKWRYTIKAKGENEVSGMGIEDSHSRTGSQDSANSWYLNTNITCQPSTMTYKFEKQRSKGSMVRFYPCFSTHI